MTIRKLFITSLFLFTVYSCKKTYCPNIELDIIPEPISVLGLNDEFVINEKTSLSFDDEFKISVNFLKSFVFEGSKIQLNNQKGNASINFIKDITITKEGYKLEVLSDTIKIKASSDQGAFYAVQSLRQLMLSAIEDGSFIDDEIKIEAVSIEDAPEFQYRGMHLDVGRHIYSVDFIKKYIDALAMLKMNTFHWHLTEDQGWRIEIKKYPKLQEISAYRDETLVGHYSDQPHQFDGKKYGGYYTQEQIKEVVAYAEEQFVTIIPEIEMPGHSQAAIAAYPELGCTGDQIEVASKWGIFEEIYCTKDETFSFLEDVLDEVLELFPSKYIHIGGDEAPKTRWTTCSDCQKRIKDAGLKDEHELQNYFISRMEKYLNSKGRQIIGWDEILEGGLAPNATVMSWRGTSGAVEAAKSGHNVVMTPTSHCYFDYYQSDNEDEPTAIGGFLPLEKVYSFNPIPKELTKEESKYVLGVQGNVWTEYMSTEDQVEYMAFPRMLAMSEVAWSKPENKNYKDFIVRLEGFHERLEVLDINYANHLYEIEGNLVFEEGKSYYKLKTLTEGKTIRYTLDGSEPNSDSAICTMKVLITESVTIKAAVFNSKKQLGKTFMQNIDYHKAVGAKITINKEPHKAYSGSGAEGLINGISGSDSRYGDKEWLGFWGEDIEITIDLGEETEISSIETRFHNGNGQWIYAPSKVDFIFDNELPTISWLKQEGLLVDLKFNRKVKSRFIKMRVPNYGIIPEGKQGAGNKAWTFIDEIIIN